MFRMIRRIFVCGVIVGAITPLCIKAWPGIQRAVEADIKAWRGILQRAVEAEEYQRTHYSCVRCGKGFRVLEPARSRGINCHLWRCFCGDCALQLEQCYQERQRSSTESAETFSELSKYPPEKYRVRERRSP